MITERKRYDIWLGFLFALFLCLGKGEAGNGLSIAVDRLEGSVGLTQGYVKKVSCGVSLLIVELSEESYCSNGQNGHFPFWFIPNNIARYSLHVGYVLLFFIASWGTIVYRPDRRRHLYHYLIIPFR